MVKLAEGSKKMCAEGLGIGWEEGRKYYDNCNTIHLVIIVVSMENVEVFCYCMNVECGCIGVWPPQKIVHTAFWKISGFKWCSEAP